MRASIAVLGVAMLIVLFLGVAVADVVPTEGPLKAYDFFHDGMLHSVSTCNR
jgi:hypothetical protein